MADCLTILRSIGAVADNCLIPSELSLISSQNQLDSLSQGCESLTGDLAISPNYTGSLVLRNVTSIAGTIIIDTTSLNLSQEHLSSMPSTIPALTSIEMPDLLSIGSLAAFSLPSVESIFFPKVISAGRISIRNMTASPSLEFGALRNVSDFDVMGPGFR